MAKEKYRTLKKKSPVLPILVTILVMIIGTAAVLKFTDAGFFLKCHISNAPRMRCTVSMKLDGKVIWQNGGMEIQGMNMDNGQENTVTDWKVVPHSGGEFCCKGGVYGNQPFTVRFFKNDNSLPVSIPVSVIVPSDWAMSEVMLQIDADSETQTYDYTITLKINHDVHTESGTGGFGMQDEIKISGV